jgi:hypothetical protein
MSLRRFLVYFVAVTVCAVVVFPKLVPAEVGEKSLRQDNSSSASVIFYPAHLRTTLKLADLRLADLKFADHQKLLHQETLMASN